MTDESVIKVIDGITSPLYRTVRMLTKVMSAMGPCQLICQYKLNVLKTEIKEASMGIKGHL